MTRRRPPPPLNEVEKWSRAGECGERIENLQSCARAREEEGDQKSTLEGCLLCQLHVRTKLQAESKKEDWLANVGPGSAVHFGFPWDQWAHLFPRSPLAGILLTHHGSGGNSHLGGSQVGQCLETAGARPGSGTGLVDTEATGAETMGAIVNCVTQCRKGHGDALRVKKCLMQDTQVEWASMQVQWRTAESPNESGESPSASCED